MRLLGGELLKLVKRPGTWITLGIFLGILALLFVAVGASYNAIVKAPAGQGGGRETTAAIRSLLSFPGAYASVAGFIGSIGGLFAIVFGASAAGSDWGWGMIKVAVSRGESRTRYILAKLVAVLVLLVPAVLVGAIVGLGAVVVAASISGIGVAGAGDPGAVASLPSLAVRTWLALCEQAAIGFAIATLARSQIAGLGVGIGIYFVESFAAGFWPEWVRYLPFSVVNSLLREPGSIGGGVDVGGGAAQLARSTIDQTTALVLVLAYLVASAVISAIALERAEITG
ncbi:MAG: ABC transporter permease subunit [Chloroflexi bacterium]|nr:ABC transporter permease subunit [Chloroflexota bacterium]